LIIIQNESIELEKFSDTKVIPMGLLSCIYKILIYKGYKKPSIDLHAVQLSLQKIYFNDPLFAYVNNVMKVN